MNNILACSGGIYKTFKESFFIHFNLDSEEGKVLLKKEYSNNIGKYKYLENAYKDLVIIQMIISGNNCVIAEVIDKNIYNEYFLENSIASCAISTDNETL